MDGYVVVVPTLPGPLVRVTRDPDEFDELFDELLPDTDEGPGPFDIALVVIGCALIGWRVFAGGPTILLVIGLIALILGCVLPARSLWRRMRSRSIARGLPLQVSPPVDSLVRAYDALVGSATLPEGRSAVAAAHSALVEVASLLNGRTPATAAERAYIQQRTEAIKQLTEALQGNPVSDSVIEARRELEAVAGYNSVTRIAELAAELRTRHAGP